jgi:SAM-dependent methyltransferase
MEVPPSGFERGSRARRAMNYQYVGGELELFAAATNWKTYFARVLAPYVTGDVLEVGAGMGSNTPFLQTDRVRKWTCLEPDPVLAGRIAERVQGGELPHYSRAVQGTIDDVEPAPRFDTILYIDVLEHIEADRAELAKASQRLAPSGRLVVLAPAHQSLFSPFDAAVGHHRRYNEESLAALDPPGCSLSASLMLDSAGLLASFANRFVLAAAQPSARQIAFWDRVLVPISRVLDGTTSHSFGKTVVAVWSRRL